MQANVNAPALFSNPLFPAMTVPVDLPADLPDLPGLHLPELFTDADGLARWRTHRIALDQGSLAAALSAPAAAQRSEEHTSELQSR